jgi:hypothetical protein
MMTVTALTITIISMLCSASTNIGAWFLSLAWGGFAVVLD